MRYNINMNNLTKKSFLKKVAKRLNDDLPKSEKWFLNKYKKSGINIRFISNSPFLGYIPDLINKEFKIIIEVDGSIHENDDVKKKDIEKDIKYKKHGFTVIRVIAYNEESYLDALKTLKQFEPKKKIIKIGYNPLYVGIIIKKETTCNICKKALKYSYNSKSGGDYCNICFDLILTKSLE